MCLCRCGVTMASFSVVVFDECHHASGNHAYVKLLKLVGAIDPAYRPRLVGLTASPCKANTLVQARRGLDDLLRLFGEEALMYRPAMRPAQRAGDTTVSVCDAEEQMELGLKLWDRIQRLCTDLGITGNNSASTLASSLDELLDDNSLGAIKGLARDIALQSRNVQRNEQCDELMRLLSAWESNAILGPYHANLFLSSGTVCGDCSIHRDVPQERLSAQLAELERQIDAAKDVRCLIFVDTMDAAELLTQRLRVRFPHLLPGKVVGHASARGMTRPEQRKVIQQFRSAGNSCRLIVCTSVLEEGFDVPQCNLVFRMRGRASLIQQVQSRGRARAANGKLVTITSPKHESRAKILRNQEENLDAALDAQMERAKQVKLALRWPDADHDHLSEAGDSSESGEVGEVSIREFIAMYSQDIDSASVSCDSQPGNEDGGAADCGPAAQVSSLALKMFLRVEHSAGGNLTDNILRAIEMTGLVQQGCTPETNERLRIQVWPPGGANVDLGGGSRVLHDLTTVAILSIPTGSRRFFQRFASRWQFEVKGAKDVSIPLPSTGAQADDFQPGSKSTTIEGISKVSVGYMPDPGTFCSCGVLSDSKGHEPGTEKRLCYKTLEMQCGESWSLQACVEPGRQEQPMGIGDAGSGDSENGLSALTGGQVEVAGRISLLGPCVYISAIHGDRSVVLYLPLQSTPVVSHRRDSNDRWRRVCAPLDPRQMPSTTQGSSVGGPVDCARTAAEEHLCMLATQPVLAIEFHESSWDDLVEALADPRCLGVPALVTRVHGYFTEPGPREANNFGRGVPQIVPDEKLAAGLELDFAVTDALLAFACLETQVYCLPLHPRCLNTVAKDVRKALDSHREGKPDGSTHLQASTRAMRDLLTVVADDYMFVDAAALYQRFVEVGMARENSGDYSEAEGNVDKYFDIARAVATPSRVICRPSVQMKSSRAMRLFAPRRRLVYVTFRDEEGQQFYTQSVFDERFRQMMEPSGIPGWQMQGLRLRLLMCSGSQQREQTAVFVVSSSEDEVTEMRAVLIHDPEDFAGKMFSYMSRLGLFCTADYPVMDLPPEECEKQTDVRCVAGTKVLSDGSGFIDSELLAEIAESWSSVVPSCSCAIQIRHSGNKGVLVMKRDLRNSHRRVVLRDSMVKCRSNQIKLCVVKAAVYGLLRLNRDVLNLLFSLAGEGEAGGDWEVFPVIFDMQEVELSRLAAMLTKPDEARRELIRSGALEPDILRTLEDYGEVLPNERHFRRLLQHIYDYGVRHLRSKTHIPVQNGALLMGIPDPTGSS